MARDNLGRFERGSIPKHKGRRKYKIKCQYCENPIKTSDKRKKFCNHSCSMKFRFANWESKEEMHEEYLCVRKNGKRTYVHRLVYEREIGEIPEGHIVHHKNEDKLDNRPENLQLMTISEHASHHHKLRRGE